MNELKFKDDYTMSYQMTELYNKLRTTIEFSGDNNNVICITSCEANDGKSTVARFLSDSLAKSGNKVLLIDADLRNSIAHRYMDIPAKTAGLCHFLVGKADLSNVVYSTNHTGLYFVPTGATTRFPSELLGNERFSLMIEQCRKFFDYIIIDTPPVGAVVDAVVVANNCDAYAIVAASGVNKRTDLMKAIDDMSVVKSRFLGIILNKVKMSSGSRYYSYGYGKKYGK